MCGIWAIMSKQPQGLYQKDVSVAQQMMLVTAARGMHSTGIAVTNYKKPKNRPRIWKALGGPCFLMQNKAWEEVEKFIFQDGGAIFGHGRWATKGNITAKNAHPFVYKNITLVHNGTIHSGLSYEKTEEDHEVEVDSHALCIKIANDGIVEALKDINGAYAIIAHDQTAQAIYFAKNSDRPLYYFENSERLLLMSTKESLNWTISSNQIYGQEPKIVETDKIFKFDLNTLKVEEVADIRKKWSPPQSTYCGGRSHAYDDGSIYGHTYNDYHRSYPFKKEEVEFLVEHISKIHDTEYLYEAEDETGTKVEFKTNTLDTSLLNQIGKAEVSYEILRNNTKVYFVKFRSIEWRNNSEVETLNGKKMLVEKWRELIKDATCGMCGDPILDGDYAKTIIKDDTTICKSCVSTYLNPETVE